MFAQIYFLFTQPDEDHCKEAEGPGLVHAGGEGGVTEVVGAVAELLQHVLALVRLAFHVQHRPLGRTAPRHPHAWKYYENKLAIYSVQSIYHFHI